MENRRCARGADMTRKKMSIVKGWFFHRRTEADDMGGVAGELRILEAEDTQKTTGESR
jgi:hypothetical protein